MAIALKPHHLKRYKDIAQLFIKYGRNGLLTNSDLDELPADNEKDSESEKSAQEFVADLEEMGPVFVKFGQVLSSRADLLPVPYLKALARLQSSLEPFAFDQAETLIQQELGVRTSKAFLEIEPRPIGVASLAQVHRAVLRDGREVAVKVQRPGIRKQIAEDFEALEQIAGLIDAHTEVGRKFRFRELLEEFRKNLVQELDFVQEARNLQQFSENLQEFEHIIVPSPIDDYTTSRVLTMDYMRGKKITATTPLAQMEIDGGALAEELFRAYLKQILLDGMFHADPHPGNVLVTDDGLIALIDLGMVGHLSPDMREQLVKFLIAVSEGRSEDAAEVAIMIGELNEDFDERSFRRRIAHLVARQNDVSIGEIEIGRAIIDFSRVSGGCGVRMPTELTMLGKALLTMDEIGRTLDPSFNPNESIRRNSAGITRKKLQQSLSPGSLINTAFETRDLVSEMPGRINRILDLISRNQLKVNVEAIDEATLIEGFQKVANRIAVGVIIAALIVGAALLMRVETRFTLFGYPGLAMVLFLAAACLGFWTVLGVLITDRASRRKNVESRHS